MPGLVLIMLAPNLGSWDLLFDDACVFVLLPGLVFTASTARLSAPWRKAASVNGDLSYLVYAIHYPFVQAIAFAGMKLHLLLPGRLIVVVIGPCAIVAGSAIVYVVCDMPVRRRLSGLLRGAALQHRSAGAQ